MDDDYFKVLALSKSLIPSIRRSGAHFKTAFESTRQTKSMKRGSLIHLMFYEPHKFGERYAVYEGPTEGTGSRKEKKAFEEANAHLEIVTQEEVDEAKRIAAFVHADPKVQRLMRGGKSEVAVFKKHPVYGVPVKCKFDHLSPTHITDLKTTTVDSESWEKGGLASKQYLHAAWYRMMGKLLDGKDRRFAFIVVDITPPYEVFLVDPRPDLLAIADKQCEEALIEFKNCYDKDEWNHKPSRVITWEAPAWMRLKYGNS